ncbi:MAG: Serine hydroxymethyltransferase [Patescibacteria group bacterium]|jgi:glycine hydroxymethyltransferase|nr:Serine hydroxymethyltransferase [Patescibacteria group bacterium]
MNILSKLTQNEVNRQKNSLNLIASENYPSPKTLQLLGSIWNDKYAEGYPGKRYYAGNKYADELEELTCQKALEVFDKTGEYGVNVQALSGSPANAVVYLTVLEAGDTVLSLDLASGGHLSHLHSTSNYLKFFKFANYSLQSKKQGSSIDVADFAAKLKEHKPRLVIIGFSSYPRKYEFAKLCEIAHEAGALVLADISHIAGLVAAGEHDSPFKKDEQGADFVTTTTHKTMRGPRSALIFAKQEYMPAINKTIFPGTSGGPHLNQIAAVGQSLLEILGEDEYPDKQSFIEYSQQVVANTKSLENGLEEAGVDMVMPTQNHLCLVELPEGVDSLDMQNRLESLGIVTNRNTIPGDDRSAWRPGGLRLGTAALTSRGLDAEQARELGVAIGSVITDSIEDKQVKQYAQELANMLHWYY